MSGMLTQFGIGTSSPVDVRIQVASEGLVCTKELRDANELRGTLSSSIDRVVTDIRRVRTRAPIRFSPNVYELGKILEWHFGGSPSGTGTVTYPLSDTRTARYVTSDRVSKVFTYNGVKTTELKIIGTFGQPIMCELSAVGIDETVGNSGTFPSLSLNTATPPWVYSQVGITSAGTTIYPKNFTLSVRYVVDEDRFFHSPTLVSAVDHDRIITFQTSIAYRETPTIYDSSNSGGVAVVITLTNGSNVATFSMVKVAFPGDAPEISGREEIMLPIAGRAYKSGSTLELVTTIAS